MQSMRLFGQRTVVEKIREALRTAVHFGDVGPARGRPQVLWIEGPGAMNGVAQRIVVGHERALRRAGFREVECIGVDPNDDRGRQGRLRARIPDDERGEWSWERHGGEVLQQRIMAGDEGKVVPRIEPVQDEAPPKNVVPMKLRRRR